MPYFQFGSETESRVYFVSISSARTFIEKSGCGLVVGLVLAIVITFSLLSGGVCGRQDQGQVLQAQAVPVATVGGEVVALQAVDNRFRQGADTLLRMEGGAPPEREAEVYAEALDFEIRVAAQRSLAKKRGLKVTDQRILDEVGKQFDSQMAMQRAFMMQSGQIKAGATEAEAQAELSKLLGKDVAQARAQQIEAVEKALQDPNQRGQFEDSVLRSVLMDSIAAGIHISEDELKKDLETVVTKRIVWLPSKHPGQDLKARAEEVLKEIKGGLSFEAAMEKYSDDPAPPNKKKGEATVNLTRAQISYDDKLSPLAGLEVGGVTPVFTLSTGEIAIYKVVKIDAKLPDNFENTKSDLMKNRIQEKAVKQLQAEIDALVESDSLKWDSKGFEILYRWLKTIRDTELAKNPAKFDEALSKIAQEAGDIVKDPDPLGARPATLVWFAAQDALYTKATGEKKKGLEESWLEAANAVLETLENVDLRIRVANAFFDRKDTKAAAESLKSAAEANTGWSEEAFKRFQTIESLRSKFAAAGAPKETMDEIAAAQEQWKTDAYETLAGEAELNEDYTDTGRERYAEINRKLARYRAAGIINAEQQAKVEEFQNKWKAEKAKADAEAAAERKKAEEEAKKAAEEAKKQADKPEAPKSPSSSDLGNTGKAGG